MAAKFIQLRSTRNRHGRLLRFGALFAIGRHAHGHATRLGGFERVDDGPIELVDQQIDRCFGALNQLDDLRIEARRSDVDLGHRLPRRVRVATSAGGRRGTSRPAIRIAVSVVVGVPASEAGTPPSGMSLLLEQPAAPPHADAAAKRTMSAAYRPRPLFPADFMVLASPAVHTTPPERARSRRVAEFTAGSRRLGSRSASSRR